MANRISQLRKSMNLSQVDLAKQMGVGQSTISNWESEKTTINSESLTKLSKLLIASAGYILGIEDGPYNGLSEKQYRSMCEEKHDEAEADALINEYKVYSWYNVCTPVLAVWSVNTFAADGLSPRMSRQPAQLFTPK